MKLNHNLKYTLKYFYNAIFMHLIGYLSLKLFKLK